jgi:putative membrane protein
VNQQNKSLLVYTAKNKWWQEGKTPDYRFTLANERTFLAWIRTALAMLAGAVGIDQFSPNLGSPLFRMILVMLLVSAGALLGGMAWCRWRKNEHAMRLEHSLPYTRLLLILAVLTLLIAGLLAVMLWQNAS